MRTVVKGLEYVDELSTSIKCSKCVALQYIW